MADKLNPTLDNIADRNINEAICIDTARVYDSCADKDCLADLRVYFTDAVENIIENAVSIRCRGCEVINVFTDVDTVPFNRGYYSVDITYFFAINLEVFISGSQPPVSVTGLCVFSKKCILYGAEGSVKVFSSEYGSDEPILPSLTTNPRAKIQVATPICLDARICRPCECCNNIQDAGTSIPRSITRYFTGAFGPQSNQRAVKVTIGLFSIIQLERDVQMLIPAYDFCMPTKECSCNTEDPCDSFRKINFPVSEFFPPDSPDDNTHCEGNSSFNPPCCCGR